MKAILKTFLIIAFIWLGVSVNAQQNNFTGQMDKAPEFNLNKSGDLLFDQISTPAGGWIWSDKFTNTSSNSNTCAAADDFDVPEGETWDVFSVEVLGSYESGGAGGGNSLNVIFMADNDGQPGDTLHEYYNYTNVIIQE